MAALELFCKLLAVKPQNLSKIENTMLEVFCFMKLCEGLHKEFHKQLKLNQNNMNFDDGMGNENMDARLLRWILNDILDTGAYTLSGIAVYTQISEEVIYEAILGVNRSPSVSLLRNLMELHRYLRPSLYRAILDKALHDQP